MSKVRARERETKQTTTTTKTKTTTTNNSIKKMDGFDEKQNSRKLISGRKAKERPEVNITNILQAAFMCADPKSAKKGSQLKQLFVLWGRP